MERRRFARPTIAFCALALTALLVGCAGQGLAAPGATETATPSATPTPSATATPTPSPTPTTAPGADAQPVGFGCDALLSLQSVYDLNPNLSVVPDPAPPAGTLAATLVGGLGIACDLVHNSNGEILLVAAATPGTETIAALRALATAPVDLGETGFEVFATDTAMVAFRADLVVTAEAGSYFGPDEFAAALRAAIASLG